jgi:hypothetical protein
MKPIFFSEHFTESFEIMEGEDNINDTFPLSLKVDVAVLMADRTKSITRIL